VDQPLLQQHIQVRGLAIKKKERGIDFSEAEATARFEAALRRRLFKHDDTALTVPTAPPPDAPKQAMSDAQRILEEYLEPRPHNNERILDKLVEVLERPDVLVAVDRLQRSGW
jgi:hypothetical protein